MGYNNKKILDSILKIVENIDKYNFDDELKEFLIDISKLPRESQIIIFNSLIDSHQIKNIINFDNEEEKKCNIDGHIFDEWVETVGYRLYFDVSMKHKIWFKKCKRCNYIHYTFLEPEEMFIKREINQINEEIEMLQKRLIKFKKGE